MIQIVRRTELEGRPRVLLTRDASGCDAWAADLARHGMDAVSLPCLQQALTDDLDLRSRFVASVSSTGAADWLVFTSPRGVEFAHRLLSAHGAQTHEVPTDARIAAVGPATARRCSDLFGRCELQPPAHQARGESLGRLLAKEPPARAVLAVARGGRRDVAEVLRSADWQVERFDLYETTPVAQALDDASDLEVDAVFLASPSAVEGLFLQAAVGDVPLLAIGPTTVRALEKAGRLAAGVAATPGLESLIELTYETLPISVEMAAVNLANVEIAK